MTGLVKPKTYDWKDSNLALFGSDTEKQVKKESAESEPAWQGAGQRAGLQIWRIVQFQVCDWSKDLYGKFYNGDSYIILNTYKPDPSSEELAYDLHFWIGSNSTQDEYGTAAYKTVELDTFLDDKAVQHRECEGHESDLFLSYFPKGLSLLEGGADTGFHHVEPEKYTPRLMHFSGKGRKVVVKQVPAAKSRLQSGDVFILDMGIKLFQWNGSDASPFEKNKAMEYVSNIKTERSGRRVDTEVLDEDMSGMSDSHPFYAALTEPDQTDDYKVDDEETDKTPHLYRVSDAGGSVEFSDVKVGAIRKSDLDSGDVFLVDTSKFCFVWVGRGASPTEKKSGLGYAHAHLQKTSNPLRSIVVVKEGQESKDFKMALAA